MHTRERKPNLSPHKKGKVALLVLASGGWWGEEVCQLQQHTISVLLAQVPIKSL